MNNEKNPMQSIAGHKARLNEKNKTKKNKKQKGKKKFQQASLTRGFSKHC